MGTWKDRAKKHLIKEKTLDPKTGKEVPLYRRKIAPSVLGSLMGISTQKASEILSQFKEDPEYEKETLRFGCCVYRLVQ